MASTSPPPRVGLRHAGRTLPALALTLRGDEAAVVLPTPPPTGGDVWLVLDWTTGETTELEVRLRRHEEAECVTHFSVHGVGGDWAPFLAYLGAHAA